MTNKLKNLKIREVSLVSRPAIAKTFNLYKSEDGVPEEEDVIMEEVTKVEETPIVEAPVEKGKKKPKPVEKKMKPCEGCKKLFAEEELDEEGMCKECAKPVKKSEELELAKQLESEKVQKEALVKELEDIKKQLAIQKDAEITKEFIQKADADMKNVPTVSPAQFGPILKAASQKLEKNEFDAIYMALKAANEFISKNSQLTKELGVGGEDLTADPAAQLEAIAKSLVDKGGIDYPHAYQKACEQNPAIYREHVMSARRH